MISDVTIQLRVKVEIHFQEEYVLPKEFFSILRTVTKHLPPSFLTAIKGISSRKSG